MKIFLPILLVTSLTFAQKSAPTVEYFWAWHADTLGTIEIPKGYRVTNTEYGEGLITHISYKDGSSINLHFGGVVKLPFCQLPGCVLIDSTRNAKYLSRSGYTKKGYLLWREDNYAVLFNTWYIDVKKSNRIIFDKSLSSFIIKKKL